MKALTRRQSSPPTRRQSILPATARRAEAAGRIREALRILESSDQEGWVVNRWMGSADKRDKIVSLLRRSLPPSPVTQSLVATTEELLQLQNSVAVARKSGVQASTFALVQREVRDAFEALWHTADRIRVAVPGSEGVRLGELLKRECDRLDHLRMSIHDYRESLAEVTLSRRARVDLATVEAGLRGLAKAARDLDAD